MLAFESGLFAWFLACPCAPGAPGALAPGTAAQVTKVNGPLAPQLGSGGNVASFVVSPDGAWCVYQADAQEDGVGDLYGVPADGGAAPRRLTAGLEAADQIEQLAVTPATSRIVYLWTHGAVRELYSAPVDGSAPAVRLHPALVAGRQVLDYRIAADGTWVAYRVDATTLGRFELYRTASDGSGSPLLLSAPIVSGGSVRGLTSEIPYQLSADGQRAVYQADAEVFGRFDLFSVPADASAGAVRLNGPLVAGGDTREFRLSADSTRVLYRADALMDERFELFSVPIDAGSAAQVVNAPLPSGGDVTKLALGAARVVYEADQDEDERFEIYSAPLDASAPPLKLNPHIAASGDASLERITPDGLRVLFTLVPLTGARPRLLCAWLDNHLPAVALDDPLPSAGVFLDVSIDPGSTRVVFAGDFLTPGTIEVFSAPLDDSLPPVRLNADLPAGAYAFPFLIVGAHVVFRAPQGWWSRALDGSGSAQCLNLPLGEIALPEFAATNFQGNPAGQRFHYVQDHAIAGQFSLWSVPVAGGTAPIELSPGMPEPIPFGDVTSYAWSTDGRRILYLADSTIDEMSELHSVLLRDGSLTLLNGYLDPREGEPGGPESILSFGVDRTGDRVPFLEVRPPYPFTPAVYTLYGAPGGGQETAVPLYGPSSIGITYRAELGSVIYRRDISDSPGGSDLWIRPLHGDTPALLLSAEASQVRVGSWQVTQDGTRVIYAQLSLVEGKASLRSVPTDASTSSQALDLDVNASDEILGFQIVPGDSAVIYVCDDDQDEVFELWRAPADGSSAAARLVLPYGAGQDVDGVFAVSPDGTWIVYRADQDQDEVFELYSVPVAGGIGQRLSGPMTVGGDVAAPYLGVPQFWISPDGARVLYRADQDIDGVTELYSSPIDGSLPVVKLNPPFVPGREVPPSSARFTPDGSRVVYAADQDSDDVLELFVVPAAGGPSIKLNPPLVAGGDVRLEASLQRGASFETTSTTAFYIADQSQDEVFELHGVPLDGSGPGFLVSAPMVASGDVKSFRLGSPRRVLYLADQEIDETFELFLSELPPPPRAPTGPVLPPTGVRSLDQ